MLVLSYMFDSKPSNSLRNSSISEPTIEFLKEFIDFCEPTIEFLREFIDFCEPTIEFLKEFIDCSL